MVDVIDLEGNIVFPQGLYFGSVVRAEDDVMTSDGIVDRNGGWSQVVRIDEAADGFLAEQRKAFVPGQVFELAFRHGKSVVSVCGVVPGSNDPFSMASAT